MGQPLTYPTHQAWGQPNLFQRRSVLGGLFSLNLASSLSAARPSAPGLAVTIDDFDLSDSQLLTGAERDRRIRSALARHSIQAAGFVAGKYVQSPLGKEVLTSWSNEGHIIGNHSFSHAYYGSSTSPDAYMADILKCEALLSRFSGFRKLFRFPYLGEGRTAEARDALRQRLHAAGYKIGHVTIDTSDWYVDARLNKRLAADPKADLAPYRRFYLNHIWERATSYDGLAKTLFGGPIDHTLLLHHRLTTALFLDDLLKMFQGKGWRLLDAQTAFASPIFALEPRSIPSGQSLMWALAKERGGYDAILRYPGEDGDYEAAEMDALGL
jgi:peptidoglycan/xylan/chitin deacetylase (PgdA/CDA1 family)